MRISSALLNSIRDKSLFTTFWQNMIAGLTVGVVALPLSMGLAIASGVPPQHGLYTAIIGGFVIGLAGGSRVNISGPTAAFVVILFPIVQQYGLGGLLISGVLSGVILVCLGLLRVGRFIQVVPYPVVIGFTAGIGTVIAFLQLKDLLGLQPLATGAHFVEKAVSYVSVWNTIRWQEMLVGLSTLVLIFVWKRLNNRIPGYLVALCWGTLLALMFNSFDWLPGVETIASRFSYSLDGNLFSGIPPMAPAFSFPWQLPGADGGELQISVEFMRAMLQAAFTIAILGALESLLCATVADGMTGEQHDPDSELVGQGIGNIIVPFFGGIPVTAAIARTALNIRTGGTTPLAAVIHSIFILLAVLLLAPLLSLVPMAAMAAVLVAVAWNMSEARHVVHLIKNAPRGDVAVFTVCYGLTVLIDMQIAVAAGLILAALLFIRRMSELTETSLLTHNNSHVHAQIDPGVVVYDVSGPLFFGAAHKALRVILSVDRSIHSVVLDMTNVSVIDSTAMANLRSISETLARRQVKLYLLNARPKIEQKMRRFGFDAESGNLNIVEDLSSLIKDAAESGTVS
ncbi:MAG: SulP family sulfate permease [Paraglaciecola sp.]|jgi:SulP family sulfate permease